jgi:copper chaperone CopZ
MRRHIVPFVASLGMAGASLAGQPARTTLSVNGLGCDGCASAFERRLAQVEGVATYEVRVAKGQADVTYDSDKTDAGAIGIWLLKGGFDVRLAPWEPVDASFAGCSNGFCGSRRPNARVSRQPGASPGDAVYCPVSGVVLQVNASTPRELVDGKPVYVCCEGCLRHFRAHPDVVLALRGIRRAGGSLDGGSR